MRSPFTLGLCLVTACAVSGQNGTAEEQDSSGTQYAQLTDFNGVDIDGFINLRHKLEGEFGDVCGDTFCGGDFSNLTPLTLQCSVTSKQGQVHDCVWTFAGSYAFVDSKTAALGVDKPSFECHFSAKTTGPKLITLLNNSTDALHETLPGTSGSIYDALGSCFQHPLNNTPFSPSSATGTYTDSDSYYVSAASQTKWWSAKAALKSGFDAVCGDTFCEGDFSDIQALQFQCAVTKSTGNIKSCTWIFGGSYMDVSKTGAMVPTSKTWSCPVPVKGTMAQLTATLTATGDASDAIHRVLPGTTASAYDAIGNCL